MGDDQLIYLERRFRQYIGSNIPLIRIFDIKNSCRAVSAMFFGRPDLAMRYPNQMFEELKENLFDENLKEIIYYTSCLALYRVNLMISNGKLPSNFRRLKWHLLLAARFSIVGKNMPIPTSAKITKSCEALIKIFKEQNPLQNKDFQRAVEYITKISNEPRNKITTRIFISSMSDELAKNN